MRRQCSPQPGCPLLTAARPSCGSAGTQPQSWLEHPHPAWAAAAVRSPALRALVFISAGRIRSHGRGSSVPTRGSCAQTQRCAAQGWGAGRCHAARACCRLGCSWSVVPSEHLPRTWCAAVEQRVLFLILQKQPPWAGGTAWAAARHHGDAALHHCCCGLVVTGRCSAAGRKLCSCSSVVAVHAAGLLELLFLAFCYCWF